MTIAAWCKFLIVAGCIAGAHGAASAAPSFEQQLRTIAERVSLAPRAAQAELEHLQSTASPLSASREAMLYEQMALAKFHAKDFQASREYGSLIEALGKRSRDVNIECLGVLYQVYGNWKLGKIGVAYALVDAAERFPAKQLSTYVRVKSLATTAQMEAEEKNPRAALLAADKAMQLARSSNDSAMIFMATQSQAVISLSVANLPAAMKAMEQLLDQSRQSAFPERRIRAKGVEFAVASLAGLTERANAAMAERLGLIRQLQLDEVLPETLVDYARLQLRSGRYADAVTLSTEALRHQTLLTDVRLANSAHFSHALATIYLGQIEAGKAEIEHLFAGNQEKRQLLGLLPEYTAALTHVGDANASVQAAAIQRKLEAEEALQRAKEAEKASTQQDVLAREQLRKTPEAEDSTPGLSARMLAAVAGIGTLIAGAGLYFARRRQRRSASNAGNGAIAPAG